MIWSLGTYLVYEHFAKWVSAGGWNFLSGCNYFVDYEDKELQLNTKENNLNEITLTKKGKLTFRGIGSGNGSYYWEYFFVRIK